METTQKSCAHYLDKGQTMRITFLGKGGSGTNDCPSLYVTDRNSFLVQGWQTDTPGTVEIPHLLPGFAEPRTYIGATLADTGRGTFTLAGQAVTDSEALGQLELADDETVVEVPLRERTYFGATADRRPVA
ncbi:hypothetical protein [Nocardia callitridis]|uniref:Uncharacterized protein n=1 Tax=Nocardia callitridis TaxID=648753 RepID=A0ABP9KF28_9NOCA